MSTNHTTPPQATVTILDRLRLRLAGWLLGIDPARVAQHDAMIDGLTRVSDAHLGLLQKIAGQTNRNSLALTGIFEKHRAWENADRALLSVSKRLERDQERRANDANDANAAMQVSQADAPPRDDVDDVDNREPLILRPTLIVPGRGA